MTGFTVLQKLIAQNIVAEHTVLTEENNYPNLASINFLYFTNFFFFFFFLDDFLYLRNKRVMINLIFGEIREHMPLAETLPGVLGDRAQQTHNVATTSRRCSGVVKPLLGRCMLAGMLALTTCLYHAFVNAFHEYGSPNIRT